VLHVIHRINSDYFPKQRCLLWDRNGFWNPCFHNLLQPVV
jgi:hypothetical protein